MTVTTKEWPRLSQDLPGIRDLDHCQACDMLGEIDCLKSDGKLGPSHLSLERWVEYDDHDNATAVALLLCRKCGDKLIISHPRAYRQLSLWEPHPGCMSICRKCDYREGVGCTHPDLKARGGDGLPLTLPTPGHAIFCTRGKGCHPSIMYSGPVSDCAGLKPKGE